MYFVPVKLFILEIKEKSLYWKKKKKKLSGLSMWPCLDRVSSSASWWRQAITQKTTKKNGKKNQPLLVFVSECCLTFTLVWSPRVLHFLKSASGEGLGSSKWW